VFRGDSVAGEMHQRRSHPREGSAASVRLSSGFDRRPRSCGFPEYEDRKNEKEEIAN